MLRAFALALIFLASIFLYFTFNNTKVANTTKPASVSGLSQVNLTNDWFPKKIEYTNKGPQVTAEGAILVDYETGEVLYAKNADLRLPAASTIKMMTALIAFERAQLTDSFVVSKNAAQIGEDTMGLSEGEAVELEYLLYGLMLHSGNDAAVVIAEGISKSEDSFVQDMNEHAKALGLKNTKFINPTGLDVDGESQYSSASDLATLAHFIWEKYPKFRKISSTDHIFIEGSEKHKAFDLYNQTNLLTTYPGVKGIKPGFTWEAGYCLVTYAENNGKKLIGVLLASGDRRGEMKELLDFGFGEYGIKVEHPGLDL